jgi:hypothetical protein
MHLKHKKAISYGHFLSHHQYHSQSETNPIAAIDQIISSSSSSIISSSSSGSSSSSSDDEDEQVTTPTTTSTTAADCPSSSAFQPQALQHYDPYYLDDSHFLIPRQVYLNNNF